MSKNANIIELNGKRYDALTGALLDDASAPAAAAPTPAKPAGQAAPSNGVQFVDGFVPPAQANTLRSTQPAPQFTRSAPQPAAAQPGPVMDIARPGPNQLQPHAPSRSQTLMRSAVQRPDPSLKRTTTVVSRTDALVAQPEITVVPKLSHPNVDPVKQERAVQIPRSEQIRRYALDSAQLSPVAAAIETKPDAAPQIPVEAPAAVQPVFASNTAAASTVQAPAAASLDVFERALQRANSHQEKTVDTTEDAKPSKFKRRLVSFSASAAAIVVLGGFIAYQNQSNITMHYAAGKAGIAASLPGYQPKGYKAGRFNYSTGIVAVAYKNPNSGQGFNLIQRQSNWDSDALKQDFVATHNSYYNTIEAAGRTIYTYGDNNATWVNGGIWYQIESPGGLTNEQIVKLATSL